MPTKHDSTTWGEALGVGDVPPLLDRHRLHGLPGSSKSQGRWGRECFL